MSPRRHRRGAARPLGFLAAREGNRCLFHPDGPSSLEALERLADGAERELLLACYTVGNDEVGRRVEERLAAAAARGVAVKVVVDGLGSFEIADDPLPRLREAGGRVEVFHPVAPWRRKWGWWNRDHRKFLVVDGTRGLVGGMNLAKEYVAPPEAGGMIDRKVEIHGPAAADLARLFDRTWSELVGEPRLRREPSPPEPGGVAVAIEGNGRIVHRHRILRAYREAIRAATTSIVLENPYFLPGGGLRRLLRNAVLRGVSVRVIVPRHTDAPLVDMAGRAVWSRLRQAGIDLRIDPSFVHSKIAVFDRTRTIIGSFNLDRRSLFHNLEVVALVEGEEVARAATAALDADAARAEPLDLGQWRRRPALDRWLQHAMFGVRWVL